MAWMNQEKKQMLAPKIKEVLKKYGMKGSLAVRNHSTLVVNIKQGKLDIIKNYNYKMESSPKSEFWVPAVGSLDLNPYWYHEHFTGKSLEFVTELFEAMNEGNHDRSDIMTDYFDVGWYVDVNIGGWNKPYQVI